MFNADLALSVTMTAISTLLSTVFLPINLLIYARYSYEADVIANLDWVSLFTALAIVIGAIGLGLFCSAKIHSHKFNLMANHVCLYCFFWMLSFDLCCFSGTVRVSHTRFRRSHLYPFSSGIGPALLSLYFQQQ